MSRKDGRNHYFYFTVEFSRNKVGVRKFRYRGNTLSSDF
ncbi:hypothetical protein ACOMA9_07020 [Streptococcus sp. AD045-1]